MKRTTKDLSSADAVMSVEEFRAIFGLSKQATYDAIRRGEIPSLKFGKRILIPTAKIREMLGETL